MPREHANLRGVSPARNFLSGPWRAVVVLGITQIITWGAIYYTPVLIVPLIAKERGWSIAFAMGGFSAGLFAAGLVSPYVGRTIDRIGGHVVMGIGSVVRAPRPLFIPGAAPPPVFLAGWVVVRGPLGA